MSAFEQYQALRALNAMMALLEPVRMRQACMEIAIQRSPGENHWIRRGTDRWRLSDRLRAPDKLNCPREDGPQATADRDPATEIESSR